MDFKGRLGNYKEIIDDDIAQYARGLLEKTAAEYGRYSADVMASYVDILSRGGKRMRGALVMAGYEMVGGTDRTMILQVARAIEMIHAYLLVIDDIADKSAQRRTGPTAHELMKSYHQEHALRGDATHFGRTQAENAGILGGYEANKIILELDIPDVMKLKLLSHITQTLVRTYHGQLLDAFGQALPDVGEDDALRVSEWKTAEYSVVSPLQIGAMLGGGNENDADVLQRFGRPAGTAFQLTDDVIGIFGDEEKTGKSTLDDLREGKITILMSHTLAQASAEQRMQLLTILGNPDLTTGDLEICKKIIVDTGSLEYTTTLADTYSKQALTALDDAPSNWDHSVLEFLRELTRSFVTRQN